MKPNYIARKCLRFFVLTSTFLYLQKIKASTLQKYYLTKYTIS